MNRHAGFTLIELMIVIAIIGILSLMALPSYQARVMRAQISEGMGLAELATRGVADYHSKQRTLPADNAAAGLPPADKIMGNYVKAVTVADGAVTITYGQRANKHLHGKSLTLRPARVDGYPTVPIAWVCGHASTPEQMTVAGQNRTDIPVTALPIDCRS